MPMNRTLKSRACARAPFASLLHLWVLLCVTSLGSCSQNVGEEATGAQFPLLADFTNQVVLAEIDRPMAMRFLPDGRLLLARKAGQIHIGDPNAGLPMVTADYMQITNLISNLERGILDLELDPNFADNGWVYVYYTPDAPRRGRISRFRHVENGGGLTSRAELSTEEVLWEDPSKYTDCCHYGGSLSFGPDGKLYATIGDKFDSDTSQDLTKASGKVLRLNPDGSIPTDNPFVDGPGGKEDAIWAYGLRNPFRAKWDLEREVLYISEVGGNDHQTAYEDLHALPGGAAGKAVNFGWPYCEGPGPYSAQCTALNHSRPIFGYPHAGKNAAIIGATVYHGGQYPPALRGALFYSDYSRGFLRYITFDSSGKYNGDHAFEPQAGPVVAIEEAPDGALYYLTLGGGTYGASVGDLHRVLYNDGNAPPTIAGAKATPTSGPAPLTVQFQANVTDDDGDPLTYEWAFGDDKTATGAVPQGGLVKSSHTYSTKGQFQALLRVSDGQRTSVSPGLQVRVGAAPVASITKPSPQQTFVAGDVISFSGSSTDSDEQNPGAVTYAWTVQFKHDDHFHPVLGPVSLGPEGGAFEVDAAAHDFIGDTGFRIDLKVTDSDGISDLKSVEIAPKKVQVSINSIPTGADLLFDYSPIVAPRTYGTMVGWTHHVSAPATRCLEGVEYTFESWSNGGDPAQDFKVPAQDLTLTAEYEATGSCSLLPVSSGLVLHLQAESGVAADGSGVVSQWYDQSGTGNDLDVTTGQPLLDPEAANGRSAITFDGVDDSIGRSGVSGLPTGHSDRSVMMVVRYHSDGWGGFVYGTNVCNQAFGLVVSQANSGVGKLSTIGWCGANDQISSAVGTGSGWLLHSAIVSGDIMQQYVNGEQVGTLAHVYNTKSDLLRIGRNLGKATAVAMDVAELLVFDRALSETERFQLEQYLSDTYLSDGNSAPLAQDDAAAVTVVGGGVTIPVLDNDSDSDGTLDPSSVTVVQAPTHGQVKVNLSTGTVTYTHDGSAASSDSFAYTVSDDHGAVSNPASVTISLVVGSALPVTSGLVLHLSGDQGVLKSGSAVTRWTDQSAAGNDLTVVSGGPSFSTAGPNGHGYVSFDGVDDGLGREGPSQLPTGAAERTVFTVTRYDSPGWGGFAWGNLACNRAFGLGVAATSGKLMVQGWCAANDFLSDEIGPGSGWLIEAAHYQGNTVTHYLNGIQVDSDAHAFNTGSDRLRLGVELNDRTKVDMDVAEVLVYNRALTPSEHAAVSAHLEQRYFGTPDPEPEPEPEPAPELDVRTGLVLWLNGDQGITTAGASVSTWADQSGAGNHLTIVSGNPGYSQSGLQGHGYVTFDGVDDGLGREGPSQLPTGAANRTVFELVRYDSPGWGGFAWGNLACNRAFGLGVAATSGKLMVQGWCAANDFQAAEVGKGAGFIVHATQYEAGTVTHYLDGVQIASQVHAYNTGSDRIRLGVELNDRTKIDMDVAEVLVYDRALSASERNGVTGYLMGKK